MAIVSIVLVAVALVVWLVGFGGDGGDGGGGGESYELYIGSTAGGTVITPGVFTIKHYYEGTVVNLTAEAEEGYYFIKWAGGVDTIADVNAATTTITMDDDYNILAHFGQPFITITQVAAGEHHTVGLKDDGTVVAVGENFWGQCDVGGWTDITQVAAGDEHTVGLKSDGTVVAVGLNDDGQCDVNSWDLTP